ncbi:TPA: alcohol dehydrogenase, partial [Streptococcus pyogenes]|nr:alcohol dehydrogenase [Streptococcus pyogenes]
MNWLITSQPYKELNMKAATYLSTGNLQLIDKPKPVIIK